MSDGVTKEVTKGKQLQWTSLEMMPNMADLKKRSNYRYAAAGAKRRRTSAFAEMSKLSGRETLLLGQVADASELEAKVFRYLDCPMFLGKALLARALQQFWVLSLPGAKVPCLCFSPEASGYVRRLDSRPAS